MPNVQNLTAGRVAEFTPQNDGQAFLWDSRLRGFGVRATTGSKSYICQGKLDGKSIRMTIGATSVWSLDDARTEARRLLGIIDQGRDPRQVKAEVTAADKAAKAKAKQQAEAAKAKALLETVTLGDAWGAYIEARQKPPAPWGSRTLLDNQKIVRKPSTKKTADGKVREFSGGSLAEMVDEPLASITPERVARWLGDNAHRSAQAALGFRMLSAFLNWCATHPDYKAIVHVDACGKEVRRHVQKPSAKAHDTLRAEQIKPWFEAVSRIPSKIISVYLTALLLTGARREEMASLKWEGVDFEWNTLTIKDKVEASRTIPLTPYLRGLLLELHNLKQQTKVKPLRGEAEATEPSPYVFPANGKRGYLVSPDIAYRKALDFAALPLVTLHGLRRSFKNCADDCETPSGVTAQIMGHKPSAIAERHYTHRSMDTLTKWHSTIESFILDKAGVSLLTTAKRKEAAA
jgi:integrase